MVSYVDSPVGMPRGLSRSVVATDGPERFAVAGTDDAMDAGVEAASKDVGLWVSGTGPLGEEQRPQLGV